MYSDQRACALYQNFWPKKREQKAFIRSTSKFKFE